MLELILSLDQKNELILSILNFKYMELKFLVFFMLIGGYFDMDAKYMVNSFNSSQDDNSES